MPKLLVLFLILFAGDYLLAQEQNKPRILLGNGYMERRGNFTRKEYLYLVTKSLQSKYLVVDDDDAFDYYAENLKQGQANHTEAASTQSLLRFGRLTQSDKAFTINALFFEEYIVVTIKIVDVASGNLEKTYVKDFGGL